MILASTEILWYSMYMSTTELMTDCPSWGRVLEVMTAETSPITSHWVRTPMPKAGHVIAPRVQTVRRPRVRRRILWSRIVLPLVALGCAYAYAGNQQVERQYEHDSQTMYQQVAP